MYYNCQFYQQLATNSSVLWVGWKDERPGNIFCWYMANPDYFCNNRYGMLPRHQGLTDMSLS
jgi:hypothetical protein